MCEETARPRGRVCEESRVVALMILYMYSNSLILVYVLYKSKTFGLLELLDIVGFIVGMFYGYCLWAQVDILLML